MYLSAVFGPDRKRTINLFWKMRTILLSKQLTSNLLYGMHVCIALKSLEMSNNPNIKKITSKSLCGFQIGND